MTSSTAGQVAITAAAVILLGLASIAGLFVGGIVALVDSVRS